jgi:hypothetical protein
MEPRRRAQEDIHKGLLPKKHPDTFDNPFACLNQNPDAPTRSARPSRSMIRTARMRCASSFLFQQQLCAHVARQPTPTERMKRTIALMSACRMLFALLLFCAPLLASAQSQTSDNETGLAPAVKAPPPTKTKAAAPVATVPQAPAAPLPNVLGPSAPVNLSDGQPAPVPMVPARRAPSGQQDPEDLMPVTTEPKP